MAGNCTHANGNQPEDEPFVRFFGGLFFPAKATLGNTYSKRQTPHVAIERSRAFPYSLRKCGLGVYRSIPQVDTAKQGPKIGLFENVEALPFAYPLKPQKRRLKTQSTPIWKRNERCVESKNEKRAQSVGKREQPISFARLSRQRGLDVLWGWT